MNTTTDDISILFGKLTTLSQLLAQQPPNTTDAGQVQQHLDKLMSLTQELEIACNAAAACAQQTAQTMLAQNPDTGASLLQQILDGSLDASFLRLGNIQPDPYHYGSGHIPIR
jgi:hypothetical protein